MKKPLRIYVDMSVFSGCVCGKYHEESLKLFEFVRSGRVMLVLSSTVLDELGHATGSVKEIFSSLPVNAIERIDLGPDVVALAAEYVSADVWTSKSAKDALHVAATTIVRADAIASWNFKHIVCLDKMKGVNRVNYDLGYGRVTIVTPMAVIGDDTQESGD